MPPRWMEFEVVLGRFQLGLHKHKARISLVKSHDDLCIVAVHHDNEKWRTYYTLCTNGEWNYHFAWQRSWFLIPDVISILAQNPVNRMLLLSLGWYDGLLVAVKESMRLKLLRDEGGNV